MGMTIEETIESFENMKALVGANHFAIKMGIDTMRKYQKIEQIINNAKDSDGAVKYNWLYEQIKKVVEDGNDI